MAENKLPMAAHLSCVCGKVRMIQQCDEKHTFFHFYTVVSPGSDLLSKSGASDATGMWLLRLSSGLFSPPLPAIERFGGVFFLQALQWAEVEGGPKSPLLCDLWYFVNRFTFIKVLRFSAIVGNS